MDNQNYFLFFVVLMDETSMAINSSVSFISELSLFCLTISASMSNSNQ